MLAELQNEINHLLFLYFTAIGVIQRDCKEEHTKEVVIPELVKNIKECRARICSMLDNQPKVEPEIPDNLEDDTAYLEDWIAFISKGCSILQ
jgi:hypothetical protein